jgi:hypothetical protein
MWGIHPRLGGMVGGWPSDVRRGQAMMPSSKRGWGYVLFLISLALAAVFIYAGVDKVRNPLQFADRIAAFAILPTALINLFAYYLKGIYLMGCSCDWDCHFGMDRN